MKWYYRINPCDIDRHKALAPVGDALAKFYEVMTAGTECPCCLGARLAVLAIGSFLIGLVL